VMAMTTMARHG